MKETKLEQLSQKITSVKPGEAVGTGEKQFTAVLIDVKKPQPLLAFGTQAREKFADLCDDPKRHHIALLFEKFKVRREGSAILS